MWQAAFIICMRSPECIVAQLDLGDAMVGTFLDRLANSLVSCSDAPVLSTSVETDAVSCAVVTGS